MLLRGINPFIRMDFLRHVDRIRIELLILYFKGSHVEISKLYVSVINLFLSLETVQTPMKYSIMQYLIWVFTVCQSKVPVCRYPALKVLLKFMK